MRRDLLRLTLSIPLAAGVIAFAPGTNAAASSAAEPTKYQVELRADEACTVTLDGKSVGALAKGDKKVLEVDPVSKHLLTAIADADGKIWEKRLAAGAPQSSAATVFTIAFHRPDRGTGAAADAPRTANVEMAGIGGVGVPELIQASRVQPHYPEAARSAGIEGKVFLQAVINTDGTVGEIKILREPDGGHGFAASAIAAVSQWRYRPAMKDGQPVPVYFTVMISFALDKPKDKAPKPEPQHPVV